jgi:hypothetical protein
VTENFCAGGIESFPFDPGIEGGIPGLPGCLDEGSGILQDWIYLARRRLLKKERTRLWIPAISAPKAPELVQVNLKWDPN